MATAIKFYFDEIFNLVCHAALLSRLVFFTDKVIDPCPFNTARFHLRDFDCGCIVCRKRFY